MNKPKQSSDFGPPERVFHDELIMEETMTAGVKRARVTPDPLDFYRERLLLADKGLDKLGKAEQNQRRWEAGDRLRRDHYLAGLEPRTTTALDGIPGKGPDSTTDTAIAAKTRFRKALKAVSLVAEFVICNRMTTLDCAVKLGYRGRQAKSEGMKMLRADLESLCGHYGI